MMVKVTKQVKLEIDGKDVETLANICEAARCYLKEHSTDGRIFGQFTKEEVDSMRHVMQEFFDKA